MDDTGTGERVHVVSFRLFCEHDFHCTCHSDKSGRRQTTVNILRNTNKIK